MTHFNAHAEAGEPEVSLNDYNPDTPFAVVRFTNDWDFTTRDSQWCRRVAAAWTTAAELLETQRASQSRAAEAKHEPSLDREAE